MLVYLSMIEEPRDRTWFSSVYDQYRDLMLCRARQILQNDRDAEDIVHETFLVLIDHLDRLDEGRDPRNKAFILAILENKAINLWRRRHHLGEQITYEEAIHIPAHKGEDIGLDVAIARLPAEYRSVILLRYHMGYTAREIARMTGKKEGTVTRTITRAKTRLAKELEIIQKELQSI